MASLNPFNPQGNTVLVTVTGTSSTAVQVANAQSGTLTAVARGPNNYLVTNTGTQKAYFTFIAAVKADGSLAVAGDCPACVIPTAGNPANGIPVLPNSAQTFSLPPAAWVTTIAAGAGSSLEFTPGDGV